MLYLKSLTIDKFKSFKHAELLFSKGFTCIVGPNGSGKSNICDALLFGLGETSLHRLRVNKLDSLINASIKRKSGDVLKAHVKIEFGGSSDITIVRAVRSDGKTGYKVNGKHMSRQEVIELLGRNKVHADETSTITQGEIVKITELNPRERRELIDIASGIKEFESKKGESLKELEKVSQKIGEAQIMLTERQGFLSELAKEKEVAEEYMSMNARLKALNYSVLIARKNEAQQTYDNSTSEMAVIDSKKNDLSYKADELSKKVEQLSSDRKELTNELSNSTKETGEINKKLEMINKESATLDVELQNFKKNLVEYEEFIANAQEEVKLTNSKVSSNKSSVGEFGTKISEFEKQIGKVDLNLEKEEEEESSIDELSNVASELEAKLIDMQEYLPKLQADLSLYKANKENFEKEARKMDEFTEGKRKEYDDLVKGSDSLKKKLGEINSKLKEDQGKLGKMNIDLGSVDVNLLALKEQRAVAQSREGEIFEKVKKVFGEKDGFFGKASGLCNYSSENSMAIETAAGSRFDYFVVDSIITANKIIEYLKKNSIGRATFIPINEVKVDGREQSETEISSIINVINYDEKFEKVFRYIFNNTYIIENVQQANRFGIGKHRYVTKEGELVEQSGIVSGGFSHQKRMSLSSIENHIKDLTVRKDALKSEFELLSERIFNSKKSSALAEMEIKDYDKKLESLKAESGSYERSSHENLENAKQLVEKISSIEKELVKSDQEKLEIVERLNEAKKKLQDTYKENIKTSKEIAKHGASKAELERTNQLRKEIENLRIKSAELQKENELLEQRITQLTKEISEKKKAIKAANEQVKEKGIRTDVLAKSKADVEKEIRNSGESSKKAYDTLNSIDSEIAKLSTEHGKLGAEISNLERQLNDFKVKRVQTETRLNDINAELSTYTEKIDALKGNVEEMSRESSVVSARLKELGNVNLKAPELFDEKKKDVDSAQSRVNTLGIERDAVLRMIEEIDSKKYQTFMDTFNEVNKNFSKLYNYLFPGSASIVLDNEKSPFESGLDVRISNGKAFKPLHSMSGGEKSLISLILIFAMHMCKPSSIYIFDEVDAALDKENSKKLSQLIKQMSNGAQFIVVSHNDSLIVNSDTAVGVVKTEDESKSVGLEVSSIIKNGK